MNLLGVEIIHNVRGLAIIERFNSKHIYVHFPDDPQYTQTKIDFPTENYKEIFHFKDPYFERKIDEEIEFSKNVVSLIDCTEKDELQFDKFFDYKHAEFYKYLKALIKEMDYIRWKGSKKSSLQNGKLVSKKDDYFIYAFERVDDTFYQDDSQIKVKIEYGWLYATIISSDDYIVNVFSSFEMEKNIEFYLCTYQILNNLCKHVCNLMKRYQLESNNKQAAKNEPILKRLFDTIHQETYKVKGEEKVLIDRTQNVNVVNSDQVLEKVKKTKVLFIWGPPGTGKTFTLSKITEEFLENNKSILLLSNSNIAVDGATLKVRDRILNNKSEFPMGKIIRYGYPKSEEMINDELVNSYNIALLKNPKIVERLEEIQEQKKELDKENNREEYSRLLTESKQLRESLKSFEKNLVMNASFIATTVAKACMDKTVYERKYDVVLVDEASMLLVPQVIFAASLATGKFICVGDFQQLPPIVLSDKDGIKKNADEPPKPFILKNDIYDFTGLRKLTEQNIRHEWLVMLGMQYRMHPSIANLISKKMYLGKLSSAPDMGKKVESITELTPLKGVPMVIADTTGLLSACQSSSGSYYNLLHTFSTVMMAWDYADQKNVGIITPYREEAALLNAIINDLGNFSDKSKRIKASTVHSFQGSEEDIIIYDVPDCYTRVFPTLLVYYNEEKMADRLFNVALSRTKGKFIAMMNYEWMERQSSLKKTMFNSFIKTQNKERFKMIDYLKDFSSEEIKNNLDKSFFLNDVRNCEDIVMELTGSFNESQEELLQEVSTNKKIKGKIFCMEETERKVSLLLSKPIKENRIEVKIKKVCLNPVTIINKNIIWYGMPITDADFESEHDDCHVTYYPVFRFEGKRTAHKLESIL